MIKIESIKILQGQKYKDKMQGTQSRSLHCAWHTTLLVKLARFDMPFELLKMTESWLKSRRARVVFGDKTSDIFNVNIEVPQGISLSPYLFIVFHSDLINHLGAHSGHIFADDLNVFIKPPITKSLSPMIHHLEKKGIKICDQVYSYSIKWKQPINSSTTFSYSSQKAHIKRNDQ